MPLFPLTDQAGCCEECPDGVTLTVTTAAGSSTITGTDCCVEPPVSSGCDCKCCNEAVFVDCNGDPLPAELDVFGNSRIVVCGDGTPTTPAFPPVLTYSGDTPPCTQYGFLYSTDTSCITHLCDGTNLYPFCGDTATGPAAPFFTATPTDQCADTATELCATCVGGTITYQRYDPDTDTWIDVP